jgi:hypothetical protein
VSDLVFWQEPGDNYVRVGELKDIRSEVVSTEELLPSLVTTYFVRRAGRTVEVPGNLPFQVD